jgi:hypothetical protein
MGFRLDYSYPNFLKMMSIRSSRKGLGTIWLWASLFFFFLPGLSSNQAFGRNGAVLIIQYSDSHSHYVSIPVMLGMVRKRIKEFLMNSPDGEIIVINNGDLSSRSAWCNDEGWLNFRLLAHFGTNYSGIWVPGNHEALDWRGADGRRLFIKQSEFLRGQAVTDQSANEGKSHRQPGIVPVAANLEIAPALQPYFQPYRDIPILKGTKTVRMLGYTIDDYFKHAIYDLDIEPALFSDTRNLQATIRKQLIEAETHGVDWVIPSFHQGIGHVEKYAEQIHDFVQKNPRLSRLRIPAMFAADDHEEDEKEVLGYWIFDSGAKYTFRSVELDQNGKVVRQKLHRTKDLSKQEREALTDYLLPVDRSFLRHEVAPLLKQVRSLLSRGLGIQYSSTETRHEMVLRRTQTGALLADSYVIYARQLLANESNLQGDLPVISFVNSKGYRNEDPIAGPELMVGDIYAMNPYFLTPSTFILSGAQAQTLYTSIRNARALEGIYMPQMSSNLDEQEAESTRLMIRLTPEAEPVPLASIPRIVVVMDHFLAENGYQESAWDLLKDADQIRPRHAEIELDILLTNFPKAVANSRKERLRARFKDANCAGKIRLYKEPEELRDAI